MPQTNVKSGPIPAACGEDLSNATDLLVALSHDAGTPQMLLPAAQDDLVPYLVLEGATEGENGSFMPLHLDQNIRVPIVGICNPGDTLVLADPAVEGQAGKVTVLPEDAGDYRGVGLAEEQGIDGQLLLLRPLPLGVITVT
jgi:hypothetical protein